MSVTLMASLLLTLAPQNEVHHLKNGVTVHVLQVKAATEQSAFTMLPVGLDSDPAGRAQFSHLAEHMLIRSTDAKHLQVGKIRLNGETTTRVMRLESLGPAADWRAALTRHARWLTARKFDSEVLAREKVRIESEERFTIQGGFLHKWATVAWGQFVPGRKHAAVHGDVANATVPQLERYVAARVRVREARIFLSGPRSAAELVAVLEAAFAKIPAAEKASTSRKTAAESRPVLAPGHRKLSWDLAAMQYIEWYELPSDCTRAEADLLSRVVYQGIVTLAATAKNRNARAAMATRRGDRSYLLLSSAWPEGKAVADAESIAKIQKDFSAVLSFAKFSTQATGHGEVIAKECEATPDFVALRKRVPPRMKSMIEANYAMQMGYASARLGLECAEVPAAYRTVRGKRLRELIASLTKERRFSATIEESK